MNKESHTSRLPATRRPQRTIRQQFIWSNVTIGVLILLAGGIVTWQVNRLVSAVSVLQVAREGAVVAFDVRQNSTQLISTINRLLPVEDAATFETDVSTTLAALRKSYVQLVVYTAKAEHDETLQLHLNLVNSQIDNIIGIGEVMIRQARTKQWSNVRVRMGVLVRDQQQLTNNTNRLVVLTKEIEEAANEQVALAQRGAVLYPALVVALTLTLVTLLVWRTQSSITQPISALTEVATAITEGNLDRSVVIEAGNEIDLLAQAFNAMTKRLRNLIDTLEDRVQERTQKLRESEEKFRNLAEKSPNMIFINQRESIVYTNEICEEVMGYLQEEFYAPDFGFFNLIVPESVETVKENYRRHMQGQEVSPYEFQLLTKNGKQLDAIHTTRLITYEGEPAILGIVTDITERKQMENRIERLNRLKENLLSSRSLDEKLKLITNAIVAIFEADFARIWLTKPGDRCDIDCLHAKVVEESYVCRYRNHCLHLFASSGQYTHLAGEEHRRVPFGCYKIGRIAAGEDSKFITNDIAYDPYVHDHNWARELGLVSFAGYRLLSASEEPIGVLALFSKHAISPDKDALLEGLANTTAQVIQTAGTEEALQDSNRRLEDTLADLMTTQVQMVQQERLAAVGQLAAGIAHDFNNILTSILGFAELLQIRPETSDAARLDLGRIVTQSQRAAHLVRQILDFSRKTIRRTQQLDLVLFLRETVHFLERTIPENIYLHLEIKPDECLIDADSTQLQQVMTNLAVNSRDAMPEGGTLSLRLARFNLKQGEPPPYPEMSPGEWVVFSVSDTGMGIPAEILSHIFEPFFTTKEVGQGTGLGLAQVYGIVRQHEGHIDVASQPGQGTTFTIYLPALVTEKKTATAEIATNIPRGHGEIVLLVEDEPSVLAVGQAMLKYLGYRVLTATNGQEALVVYAEYKTEIALVITDMIMPEIDGVALFHALQIQNPEIKVVLMTGHPLGKKALEIKSQDREEWLQKPLSMAQLAQVVSRTLQ